jgi:hypothetical protein
MQLLFRTVQESTVTLRAVLRTSLAVSRCLLLAIPSFPQG